MICPKCRVKIANTNKYCPRCGEILDHSDLERLGNKLENNLLKMYYYSIIFGLAVGVFFHLMLYGLFLFLDSMGFYALLLIYLLSISVFINIYYIFKFDDLYLTRAKGYIARIINEYGTSDVELLTKLCEKDSKGNLFVAILSIILFIGVFVYLLFIH